MIISQKGIIFYKNDTNWKYMPDIYIGFRHY